MRELIPFCNDWAVGLFGSVLAAYFCSALTTRRNKWIFWVSMTLIPVAQSWIYYLWDGSFLRKIYPLLVHLPLFLVLLFLTRRALWPLISIFTAYLCCQLRRWIALFVIQLLGGGELMRCSVEMLVPLPLLLALLKWAAPTIANLGNYPTKTQCLFGSVPVMYYAFDYLTRVYSDILISGEPVAVEFMPFLCSVAYLVFLLHYSKVERDKIQAEQVQNNMSMQLAQAVRQIDAMRESQDLASLPPRPAPPPAIRPQLHRERPGGRGEKIHLHHLRGDRGPKGPALLRKRRREPHPLRLCGPGEKGRGHHAGVGLSL